MSFILCSDSVIISERLQRSWQLRMYLKSTYPQVTDATLHPLKLWPLQLRSLQLRPLWLSSLQASLPFHIFCLHSDLTDNASDETQTSPKEMRYLCALFQMPGSLCSQRHHMKVTEQKLRLLIKEWTPQWTLQRLKPRSRLKDDLRVIKLSPQ